MPRPESRKAREAEVAGFLCKYSDQYKAMTRADAKVELERVIGRPVDPSTISHVLKILEPYGLFDGFMEPVVSTSKATSSVNMTAIRCLVVLMQELGLDVPDNLVDACK